MRFFRWFPWRYLCFMGNVIQACDNEVLGGSWWLRPIGSLWWAWPLGAKDGSQYFEKMVIIKSYNLVMATSTSSLPYKEGRGQTSNPLFHYECGGKDHKILFWRCRKLQPGSVSALTESTFSAKNIFMPKKRDLCPRSMYCLATLVCLEGGHDHRRPSAEGKTPSRSFGCRPVDKRSFAPKARIHG